MRKTKIICTIGPSSSSDSMLRKLIGSGMDVARLNFSHGTVAEHQRVFRRLRSLARETKRPLAIMQDIQGPRIRLGKVAAGRLQLKAGQCFVLSTAGGAADVGQAPVQAPQLHREIRRGDRVMLADGTVQLRVVEVRGRKIVTRVVLGGIIGDHQGMNLPDTRLAVSAITEKDRRDLAVGVRLGFDLVAVSFVRSAQDVLQVRRILHKAGGNPLVLAKIEHPLAVKNLDDILEVSDGVIIARGDLGVELPPEKLPGIQKNAIIRANQRGKLVVVATQMLESMRSSSRPTRAEASDVANAVFDGADTLMLSGETASGNYPLESLQMMVRIIVEAEKSYTHRAYEPVKFLRTPTVIPRAVSLAACVAAGDVNARIIVAFTESGNTARIISDHRPQARIVALTPRQEAFNLLAAFWGVEPIKVPPVRSTDAMLRQINRTLLRLNLAKPGEAVVIVSGVPIGQPGSANLLKIHHVH